MTELLKLASQLEAGIKSNQPVKWAGPSLSIASQLTEIMLDFPETPSDFNVRLVPEDNLFEKVILVSGGADSTIMWELNRDVKSKKAVYVDLGHSYVQKELDALKLFGIEAEVISHPLRFESFWKHIIPTRNFVLIAHAEQFVANGGEIWLGAVQGESAPDKGDKSDLFFYLIEKFIWQTRGKSVKIRSLKDKTKNDWLKWYIDTTGDHRIIQTITCFDGSTEKPCGKCQACVRKWISLRYCGLDTDIFEVNPYEGGAEFIQKYKVKMQECLDRKEFNHYSEDRCKQDLRVILDYEASQKS
jgi:hypothetical protein